MSDILHRVATDATMKEAVAALRGIQNAIEGKPAETVIYGFYIDGAEADPSARVSYVKDAVGKTPAKMNFTTGRFDWGSWEDAFFIPRPCMLKYDGTVDYYLDADNYALKADGTPSDVADLTYGGNAMMEWGRNGQKIWMKIVPDPDDSTSGWVYIANYKADDGFTCWPFYDSQNNLIDHFYTPIYNGSLDTNGKLRSISGQAPINSKTAAEEITAAEANNASTDKEWYTEVLADISLINALLVLIGKSTDTQAVFGEGHTTGASSAAGLTASGTLNDKGLFWGSHSSTTLAVKVFGMENYWGNQWRRYAGHILDAGTQKVKLTYGTADGSTASAYNTTGANYKTISNATPTGTSGGYAKYARFAPEGIFPFDASGEDGKYYSDGLWFSNSGARYALRGGAAYGNDRLCGAFYVSLYSVPTDAYWYLGAAPSCKPVYREGE